MALSENMAKLMLPIEHCQKKKKKKRPVVVKLFLETTAMSPLAGHHVWWFWLLTCSNPILGGLHPQMVQWPGKLIAPWFASFSLDDFPGGFLLFPRWFPRVFLWIPLLLPPFKPPVLEEFPYEELHSWTQEYPQNHLISPGFSIQNMSKPSMIGLHWWQPSFISSVSHRFPHASGLKLLHHGSLPAFSLYGCWELAEEATWPFSLVAETGRTLGVDAEGWGKVKLHDVVFLEFMV